MADKRPGSPRKTTSAKKEKPQFRETKAVTPISQRSGAGSGAKQFEAAAFQDDIQSEIRRRAYELFEERGRREGFADEDWARAEAEVISRYQRGKSA
jgi:hypothetical protein